MLPDVHLSRMKRCPSVECLAYGLSATGAAPAFGLVVHLPPRPLPLPAMPWFKVLWRGGDIRWVWWAR